MDFHKEGGNYYDDIRIDLDRAFESIPPKTNEKRHTSRCLLTYMFRCARYYYLQKTGIIETLVMIGLEKKWFQEYLLFWEFLNGRPISLVDFHGLRMVYRIRGQVTCSMNWDDNSHHLNNWKNDNVFGGFLNQLYGHALKPFRDMRYIKSGSKVLEYGCSHAPYYRSYRRFYGYKKCKWTLADIKNHAYLYSNYCYRNDEDIEEFIIIDDSNIDNPLSDEKKYDIIFCTTVFEHLHAPRLIAEVLLDHLMPGGTFVFDYILGDGRGLDSKQGKDDRLKTLEYIKTRCSLIKGDWSNVNKSIGLCFVKLL